MLDRYGMINAFWQDRWNKNITIEMKLFDLTVLWYYCFGGSIVLRPMVSVFWPAMAVLGLFVFRVRLIQVDKYKQLAFMMIIVIAATTLYSVDSGTSLKYSLSILLYFVIAIEITSRKSNVKFFLNALCGYSLVLLAVSFIEKYIPSFYTSTIMSFLPSIYHPAIHTFIRNGSVNGFFNQTSSNAVAMSLGVGVFLYKMIQNQRDTEKRTVSFAIMMAFVYGIVLTVRRASLLAIILILMVFLYSSYGNTFTKLLVVIAAICLVFGGGVSTIPILSNIVSKTALNAAAGDISDGRFTIWLRCFQLFSERPVLGYGADSLQSAFSTVNNAHNSFIQSFVELGFIGTGVFYMPFIYGFVISIKAYSRRRELSFDDQALVSVALFWQTYSFINAMFEALFASETAVFMMFIMQMIVMQVLLSKNMTVTRGK